MPRHNRRAPQRARTSSAGGIFGGPQRVSWQGIDWRVQPLTGSSSAKVYRCPGCDQEIRPGTGHVVAWPEDVPDDRRHWHRTCWDARDRRTPGTVRSRNAPRYGR